MTEITRYWITGSGTVFGTAGTGYVNVELTPAPEGEWVKWAEVEPQHHRLLDLEAQAVIDEATIQALHGEVEALRAERDQLVQEKAAAWEQAMLRAQERDKAIGDAKALRGRLAQLSARFRDYQQEWQRKLKDAEQSPAFVQGVQSTWQIAADEVDALLGASPVRQVEEKKEDPSSRLQSLPTTRESGPRDQTADGDKSPMRACAHGIRPSHEHCPQCDPFRR